MGSNRFKWVLVGLIAVAAVVALFNRSTAPSAPPPVAAPVGPQVNAGDRTAPATADTTVETLKTVQVQYGEQRRRNDELLTEVTKLKTQLNAMSEEAKSSQTAGTAAMAETLSRLQRKVDELATSAATQMDQLNIQDLGYGTGPSVYEFDTGTADKDVPTNPSGLRGYTRLVPLTTQVSAELSPDLSLSSMTRSTRELGSSLSKKVMETTTPYYTIPARATGFDAVALTALIGRVPVSGSVVDPFPVKLVLGQDNLAANGHHIPGLDGIILDGIAQGDWTLGCVSVKLTGGTYVFEDGSINHMSGTTTVDDSIESGVAATYGDKDAEYIGYISDTQGVPCIRGKKLTDAYKQASWMALLGAAKGHAEYRASAEQTTTTGVGTGTVVGSVTGDKGAFSRYGQAASGLEEFMRIYQERYQDTFDAVYAPAGIDVAVHFTRDLRIDHRSNARRLVYDQSPTGGLHALD